jgi:hypothetical protein
MSDAPDWTAEQVWRVRTATGARLSWCKAALRKFGTVDGAIKFFLDLRPYAGDFEKMIERQLGPFLEITQPSPGEPRQK